MTTTTGATTARVRELESMLPRAEAALAEYRDNQAAAEARYQAARGDTAAHLFRTPAPPRAGDSNYGAGAGGGFERVAWRDDAVPAFLRQREDAARQAAAEASSHTLHQEAFLKELRARLEAARRGDERA